MNYDFVVIGGGISGLSAAWYAQQAGQSVVVLERTGEFGGCIQSAPLTSDFWTELGAHSLFNSYGGVIDLLQDAELSEYICKKGKLQFQLWTAKNQRRSIVGALNWLELLRYGPRFFRLQRAGKTVSEYYGQIVGPQNFARVFAPAFSAVICQPAHDFPADALFGSRPRRQKIPRSFTLSEGIQMLTRQLARQLTVVPHAEVTALHLAERATERSEVTVADGRRFYGRHLVVATPIKVTNTLLSTSCPSIAALLNPIESAMIYTTAVVVSQAAVKIPPLAGLIGESADFYSAVSRDYRPHPTLRSFTFHFKPHLSDETQRIERIAQTLQISANEFVATHHKINELPILRRGHQQRIAQIDDALTPLPLHLTGNYLTGLSLEDCVQRSQKIMRSLGHLS